jgi:hypothetical protein
MFIDDLFTGISDVVSKIGTDIKSLVARRTYLEVDTTVSDMAPVINAKLLVGEPVLLGKGVYPIGSTLLIQSNTSIFGLGKGVTTLKALPTLTGNVMETAGLQANTDNNDFTLRDFTIDGGYLPGDWNASTPALRTTGSGLVVQGYGWDIDIELYNCPEHFFIAEDIVTSIPKSQDNWCRLKLNSRVCGKEGIILYGTNDFIAPELFCGLFGLLPRPEADTTMAVSTRYPTDGYVDGIVLDGINIELGTVHVYAGWSGRGFVTRGTCRLKCEHLISESNNGQVEISSGTYGAGITKLETRNLGVLHPNWTATIPTYTLGDRRWTVLSCASTSPFSLGEVTIYRNVPMTTKRVVGCLGAYLTGFFIKADFICNNTQTEASGGSETGGVFKAGDGIYITGGSNTINVLSRSTKGKLVYLADTSRENLVRVNAKDNEGICVYLAGNNNDVSGIVYGNLGSQGALYRDGGATNSYRNSRVNLTMRNCTVFFETLNNPLSEVIDLLIEARSTDIVWQGTAIDRNRSQRWFIDANINNTAVGTRGRTLSTTYSETITTEQTITVAHKWLYAPSVEQVMWSLSDSATISNAVVEYIRLNSIDATNLTFKVKLSTAATNGAAANTKLNVVILP